MSVQEIEKIKKLVDAKKEERARAIGALEPIMNTLKEEFGAETLEEAEKKLNEQTQAVLNMEVEYTKKLEELRLLIK